MTKKITYLLAISFLLMGCSPKIPMAPEKLDTMRKQFNTPTNNKSGIYIYRNSFVGSALTKTVYIDDKTLGSIANKTYLYKEVVPGKHKLATTSEFSPNLLAINTLSGKNYYFTHYIKMGLIVGGANIEAVSEKEGKKEILECKLAQ
ncbi:MAG: DUF2846 domain-containing protein [Sulfurovum sp.]|nr:DUF2846 domain-containing protein [Sulfurovum sp.]